MSHSLLLNEIVLIDMTEIVTAAHAVTATSICMLLTILAVQLTSTELNFNWQTEDCIIMHLFAFIHLCRAG